MQSFIRKNAYYVDKTEIMYELVQGTENKVTLFTRPRRFGKTLMMSMMENYFSIRKDGKAIFEGLDIARHEEFCREWMNHAFLAGILVGRGYGVESNSDILLKDRKNRRALIIEAKKSKKEADMDKDCDEALSQIVTSKYAEGLYGYEQVLCYGIAFFRKQAKVKKGRG